MATDRERALTDALNIASDESTACKANGNAEGFYACNRVWHALIALRDTPRTEGTSEGNDG